MAFAGGVYNAARGLKCHFGGTGANQTIEIISVSVSQSMEGGVDITSMGATVYTDSQNTNNKFVYKSMDPTVRGELELTVEFFGPGIASSWLGARRNLSFSQTGANPPIINVSGSAYVQSLSTSVVTGDMVKGTITFRL